MAKHISARQQIGSRVASDKGTEKKSNPIQRIRFTLNDQEQKCLLYVISKIQPEDTALTEYAFDIEDLYTFFDIEDQGYTRLKQALKRLSEKSWWAATDNKGTETLLHWFSKLCVNKRSGKVTVIFHEAVFPFLLQMATQEEEQESPLPQYGLEYVLQMRGRYSPRLYNVLESYQKNNQEWNFDIDELKKLLDCQSYDRWPDFRRFVLDPAVNEINEITNFNVVYVTEQAGRKVNKVTFFIASDGEFPQKTL